MAKLVGMQAGHDQRATVWLAKLDAEPASRAAMVLLAGYGPVAATSAMRRTRPG